ncbi:MAG: hypothetical protein ACJAUH_002891 [Saprospiraceae bacterium]|jgi:hypothetical protein
MLIISSFSYQKSRSVYFDDNQFEIAMEKDTLIQNHKFNGVYAYLNLVVSQVNHVGIF